MNRHGIGALIVCLLAACTSSPSTVARPEGGETDVVRLTNGDVIRGRVVEETAAQVAVESGERVSVHPRSTVYSVSYSRDSYRARTSPLRSEAAKGGEPDAPSSWYPRSASTEPVDQKEVLWYEKHGWKECLGALAEEHERIPELTLFVEPGGKLVFQDPKQWGYHAHLFPGDRLEKPAGKPGLSLEMPKEEKALPESVAFVSPAQEMKSGSNPKRSSYAPPDAMHARLRPAGQADGMLAVQAFTGGRPAETATGRLWAFALPRNSSQFAVYLYDGERKHGQILKSSFVGYGDTILAADFMVDLLGADGVTLGRVLVVPFPDSVGADGPAREPVTVYAGPAQDPTAVASVALPPRQSLQLPSRTPSTKAAVLLSHYEVSRDVPETIVVAHGVDRPTGSGARIVSRELTPDRPDELVKIDVSSLEPERFPAVVWFQHRRTFAWKPTGGYLPPGAERPAAAAPVKLVKVKKNLSIPHVLPLYFSGPEGSGGGGGADPAAGIAGGMSNALMQDALLREAGRGLGGLTVPIAPSVVPGGGGGSVSSVTNVFITGPQHLPAMESSGPSLSGQYLSTYGASSAGVVAGGRTRPAPMGPAGSVDGRTGVMRNPEGQVVYDPATGRVFSQGESPEFGASIDPATGLVNGVTTPIRRTSSR